jgi:hypothetical protein
VEKSIKEMRDKKDAGNDDVPGNVRKSLRKRDLSLMTKLVNNLFVTGYLSKDFIYFTVIALKNKLEDSECSVHHTFSLMAHTAKRVERILTRRRRTERKSEDVLGESRFGFRKGKGTSDARGMLGIISPRTFSKD